MLYQSLSDLMSNVQNSNSTLAISTNHVLVNAPFSTSHIPLNFFPYISPTVMIVQSKLIAFLNYLFHKYLFTNYQ